MVTGTIQSSAYGFPEALASAQAAADAANAAGGIGGRDIRIVSCNDQNNPNIATSCAWTAVSDHAVAVDLVFTNLVPQMIPILQPAGIAILGDQGTAPIELTTSDVFPIGGGAYTMYSGIGPIMVNDAHCTKVAVVELNFAPEIVSGKNIANSVQLAGGQVTNTQAVSPTLPGYSAVVAEALASHAQCFASVLAATQLAELYQAIQNSSDPTMYVGAPVTT